MHQADLSHDNTTLQSKLERLYTLRGGDAAVSDSIRKPYLDLLAAFDNPHLNLPPTIHVAGTNGKGSSIAMMRSIYEEAGYKVHAYTSPHLLKFNERIVVAGGDISDRYLEDLIDEALRLNNDAPITFFEVTTAIAFAAFSRVKADVVLLETGLGGRLDCTNVIQNPIATLITSISMDHQDFLGHTIEAIATEKAGIMKRNIPCVVGHQPYNEALTTLQNHAKTLNATLHEFKDAYDADISATSNNNTYRLVSKNKHFSKISLNLNGLHQIRNAASVFILINLLQNTLSVTDAHIDAGLRHVHWPARLERLQDGTTEIWYDGGHNEDAGQALADWITIQNHGDARPLHVVAGMKKEKDANAFLLPFAPLADSLQIIPVNDVGLHLTASDIESSLPMVRDAKTLQDALSHINDTHASQTKKRILICGSLYLAREISDTLKT